MSRRTTRVLLCLTALAAAAAWLPTVTVAEETETGGASTASTLDEIRRDLEELRFEKALSSVEAFLASPALAEEDRVEALILRSQAHVSYGDLDAAEKDYRELLLLRPAYVPEGSLTPPKAMARFTKVRGALVGSIVLTVTPPNARVLVDDREVGASADGTLSVLAGERSLRFELPGFDAESRQVDVTPGRSVELIVQLIPNARTVVIRTRPAGVIVTIDGEAVGETAVPEGADPSSRGLAELTIENLPLGEHTFGLSKSCFRSAVFQDIVTVDLTDFSPKIQRPVVLEPARTRLRVVGAPDGAFISVDGEQVSVAPASEIEACPGERILRVVARGRTLWRSTEVFPLDGSLTIEVRPRPNAVLIGAPAWPAGLGDLVSEINLLGVESAPAASALTDSEAWSRVDLPDDADLALAILRPAADGSSERWLLYSPHLQAVHRIDGAELDATPPAWSSTVAGMHLVDSGIGGKALVAAVRAAGPAAAAGVIVGERVVSVGSQPVDGAVDARRRIAEHPPTAPMPLQLESRTGERRTVEIRGAPSPRLLPPEWRAGPEAAWVAAWAAADGASGAAAERPTALANLALLLSGAGRDAAAVETWRRVRWGDRPGVGSGTAAYYLGCALEAMSKEKEAREAFQEAGRSAGTAFNDEGPAVAPAAADHLADLGVSSE